MTRRTRAVAVDLGASSCWPVAGYASLSAVACAPLLRAVGSVGEDEIGEGGAVRDVEFAVDPAEVVVDGANAEVEASGDLGARDPCAGQPGDLSLSRCDVATEEVGLVECAGDGQPAGRASAVVLRTKSSPCSAVPTADQPTPMKGPNGRTDLGWVRPDRSSTTPLDAVMRVGLRVGPGPEKLGSMWRRRRWARNAGRGCAVGGVR